MSEPDPRVIRQTSRLRAVCPEGRTSGGKFYPNGDVIIEAMSKDCLGNPCWLKVAVVPHNPPKDDTPVEYTGNQARAIYEIITEGK